MEEKHISDIAFDDYLDSTGLRHDVEELAAKKSAISGNEAADGHQDGNGQQAQHFTQLIG